jgi:hypothetical protein
MYSTNSDNRKKNSYLFDKIIEKSLFTNRQISIIYNKSRGGKIHKRISSGAYYRQIKQCRAKIESLLYSVLLLRSLNIIDNKTMNVIESVVIQLNSLSENSENHITYNNIPSDVIDVIDKIIKKSISI